jgi:hypothetical protein
VSREGLLSLFPHLGQADVAGWCRVWVWLGGTYRCLSGVLVYGAGAELDTLLGPEKTPGFSWGFLG